MRRKVAYFGVLVALALVFSYVEYLIPIPVGIPGIKIGLANLIVMITLYKMGGKEAFLLSVVRVLLSGFMFGNLFAIVYSMAGGVFSFLAMYMLKRTNWFSVIGISMAGGVFHNIGQILIASIALESFGVFYYFPVLLVVGVLTGVLIGILANEILKRLRKI